ncbi:MAG: MBL fold metallo-hydrolase [bacterium]
MFITWLGHSCFKIQDKETVIIIDPYGQGYGPKPPRLKADLVMVSHDHNDHNYTDSIMGEPLVIRGPGEYETKGVYVLGLPSWHDGQKGQERGPNTIYRFEVDGVSLAHLGDLGHVLENDLLSELEGTDVLFIPVGGIYTINAKQAVEVISQIEPRIVIPMHYDMPEFSKKVKLDGLDKFCKEIGICSKEAVEKLKITKNDLPVEDTQVIVMSMSK